MHACTSKGITPGEFGRELKTPSTLATDGKTNLTTDNIDTFTLPKERKFAVFFFFHLAN
jgi:hypothetical protein